MDLSMGSSPTTSLSFAQLESPRSDVSSLFMCNDSPIKWKRSPNKSISKEHVEFGQLADLETSERLVIKFYYISSSDKGENGHPKMDIACQFDDFIEVPILDAGKCLECLTDERILLDNVEIEINICAPKSKTDVENVLRKFAERRERCKEIIMIKRLSFFIYDFTYARDLAPILAKIAPRVYEMNIGIPKRKTYPLPSAQEARYVADFFGKFITPRNTWETLRVLRIFYFVTLDGYLQKFLGKCIRLRHLTLSNIDEIGIFELSTVNSMLLDSCDYSITVIDETFAEKYPGLFPTANTFGFHRCPVDFAVRALSQWSTDRVAEKRQELFFYQPERAFRKFLYEATKSFEMLNDDKELEGEVQIKGHSGGPLITVFNKDREYKAKMRNE